MPAEQRHSGATLTNRSHVNNSLRRKLKVVWDDSVAGILKKNCEKKFKKKQKKTLCCFSQLGHR